MGLQLHTRNLTAGQSMTLATGDGVLYFSFQMSTGASDSGTLTGTMPFKCSTDVAAVDSAAVTLGPGAGNVFVTDSQRPMALTIACVTGTLKVIVGF